MTNPQVCPSRRETLNKFDYPESDTYHFPFFEVVGIRMTKRVKMINERIRRHDHSNGYADGYSSLLFEMAVQ